MTVDWSGCESTDWHVLSICVLGCTWDPDEHACPVCLKIHKVGDHRSSSFNFFIPNPNWSFGCYSSDKQSFVYCQMPRFLSIIILLSSVPCLFVRPFSLQVPCNITLQASVNLWAYMFFPECAMIFCPHLCFCQWQWNACLKCLSTVLLIVVLVISQEPAEFLPLPWSFLSLMTILLVLDPLLNPYIAITISLTWRVPCVCIPGDKPRAGAQWMLMWRILYISTFIHPCMNHPYNWK